MKHNIIRYSLIVLVSGSVALTAGRVNAEGGPKFKPFQFGSPGWTPVVGQIARTSMVLDPNFTDGVTVGFVRARIQLLDSEGEVITQSDEIRVEPGKIRFWDVPCELLLAGEPRGRIQVRARILVTAQAGSPSPPPLAATLELIDAATGRTSLIVLYTRAGFIASHPSVD